MTLDSNPVQLVIIITPEERKSFSSYESFKEALNRIAQGRTYYLVDSLDEIPPVLIAPNAPWIQFCDNK